MSALNWFLPFRSALPAKQKDYLTSSIAVKLANPNLRQVHNLNRNSEILILINDKNPLSRCNFNEWQLLRCYNIYNSPYDEYHRDYHTQQALQAHNSLNWKKITGMMPGNMSKEEKKPKMRTSATKKAIQPDKSPDEESIAESTTSKAGFDAKFGSMERARLETAREFVNTTFSLSKDAPTDEPVKVACPKPNLESPYLNTSEDCDDVPTLRTHYKKILQQPDRQTGIFFHRPRIKTFTYKSYTSQKKYNNQHLQLLTPMSGTSSSREMHSDSGSKTYSSSNNYSYLKSLGNSKPRVDSVQLEIIKFEKKPPKSEKLTDINNELWRVLTHALNQDKDKQGHHVVAGPPDKVSLGSTKSNQDLVSLSNKSEQSEDEEIQISPKKPNVTVSAGTSKTKESGKYCYNILYTTRTLSQLNGSTHGQNLIDSKKMSSTLKSTSVEDFSETFTDLSEYDDGSDMQKSNLNKKESTVSSDTNKISKNDGVRDADIKIAARKQHNQRVAKLFKDFNNI